MHVRTSSPFGDIHDPSDPAWIGHVEVHAGDSWWRRPRVVGLLAGLVALLGGVAAYVADDDGPREPATRHAEHAAAPGIERSPVSAPVAADEVVSIPSSEPLELGDVTPQPAKAPGVHGAPSGSGWAPAAATRDGSETGRLTGDLSGVTPVLRGRLDRLALQMGVQLEIISGWRTHREQQELHDMFLAGVGNLAAVPGTSRHESGLAADVYVDGVALADIPGAREKARRTGLHFPVAGESWHVELIETASM